MHILYVVDKYPGRTEPKFGMHPAVFRGMALRPFRRVGMLAYNAAPGKNILQEKYASEDGKSVLVKTCVQRRLEKYCRVRRLGLGRALDWVGGACGAKAAREYIGEFGPPDIVHAYGEGKSADIALKLKKEKDVPFLLNAHRSASYSFRDEWGGEERRMAEILQNCRRLLPVSVPLGRHLERVFGKNLVRGWTAVPNPVDEEIFRPGERGAPAPKRKLPLRLFHVSKLDRNKNIPALLRAFRKVCDSLDAELEIAGADRTPPSLLKLAEELGIAGRVNFAGKLPYERVAREMRGCDIYVQSSTRETFCIPVAEAMMCGRPVVTTRSGGPESLVGEDCGATVPPGQPGAIADAVISVGNALDEYEPGKIRKQALRLFSRGVVFSMMERIYKEASETSR